MLAVFETKRQRGLMLLAVVATLIIASIVVEFVASARADARASRVQERVRTALANPPLAGPDASLKFLREHDLKSFAREDGGVLVSADGGSLLSPRCVVARRNESDQVETRIVHRACHDVTVTADWFTRSED